MCTNYAIIVVSFYWHVNIFELELSSYFRLNLASMALINAPTALVPIRSCDSCTLDMATWFGFPGCPCVTLYKKDRYESAQALSLTEESRNLRLKCFPLWVALQAVGIDGLEARVKTAVQMVSTSLTLFHVILWTHPLMWILVHKFSIFLDLIGIRVY